MGDSFHVAHLSPYTKFLTPPGKALAFDLTSDDRATLGNVLAGEYDVVIFKAPSAEDLGLAKLKVEHEADGTFRMTITPSKGDAFSRSAPLDDESCKDGVCLNIWRAGFENPDMALTGSSHEVSIYNYYESGNNTDPRLYFQAAFYADGSISGAANGYLFRNAVLAYGPDVPAQLTGLTGSYSATVPGLCSDNLGTLTISADGAVSLVGLSNVDCTAKNLMLAWDGQDDLVLATEQGTRILLDSQNRGGSLPGGGLQLDVEDSAGSQLLTRAYANFEGGQGNITLNSPTKDQP